MLPLAFAVPWLGATWGSWGAGLFWHHRGMVQSPEDAEGAVAPDEVIPAEGPGEALEVGGGETIEKPAKVMRIGSMVKQLLDEVRQAPLDEAGRARLREIYDTSIRELSSTLSPDLADELRAVAIPFDEDRVPSEAELRVAQAQLVGWLEGLFHGIQAALMAQQLSARAQLDEMRQRGLPQGGPVEGRPPGYL
jgi:proteasome activator-like protein